MRRRIVQYILASVSGVALSLSFPSAHFAPLAWVSITPLLFIIRDEKWARSSFLGFLFGVAISFGTYSWIIELDAVGPGKFLSLIPVYSLFFVLFAFSYSLVSKRFGTWVVLIGPALWVSTEYMRANLFFIAWPWNLLAHSQYKMAYVIQVSDMGGVYAVSFLLVMVNSLLCETLVFYRWYVREKRGVGVEPSVHRNISPVPLILAIALIASALVYSQYRLNKSDDGDILRVSIVQGNRLTWNNMGRKEQMEHLLEYRDLTLSASADRPELIVWPAASLPAPIEYSPMVRMFLGRLALEMDSHILVGGAGAEKMRSGSDDISPFSNSEFLISPRGRETDRYDKIKLVPFNEYLPLRGTFKWPRWITTLERDFKSGDRFTLFRVSSARFGSPICWENLFPDFFRQFVQEGANLMISVTNEGFMGRSPGPYQTLASNVFRAVENRVPIVRVSTTGISAFIDPSGRIEKRLNDSDGNELFVAGTLTREVRLNGGGTFYTRHGDIFALAASVIALMSLLLCIFPPSGRKAG